MTFPSRWEGGQMEGLDTIGSISAHFSPAAASYSGQLVPNFYVYEVLAKRRRAWITVSEDDSTTTATFSLWCLTACGDADYQKPGRDLMTFLCESCLATLAVVCVCKIEVEADPQAADKWTREICYSTVSVGSFQHGLINNQLGNKATWLQRLVGGCPCPSLIKRVRPTPLLPLSFFICFLPLPNQVTQIDELVTAATQQLHSTYCKGQGSQPPSIWELVVCLA